MLNLKEIRTGRKISQQKLADIIGVSRSTIAMWETDGSQPDNEMLKKIADYFNVSTDYLLGRETPKSEYEIFSSEDITYMEIIGSVKAGYDGIAQEEHTGETAAIPTVFFKGNDKSDFFLLRVSGSSMYPKMLDGDLVLVKRESGVDNGSIAVIMYNDEKATIKTVKYVDGEEWLDLVPANPEYETKHIKGAELEKCRILGKVVKLIRDL